MSAYSPQPAISTPPTGAYQVLVILMAAGPGLSYGRMIDSEPAMNSRNRPTRMK